MNANGRKLSGVIIAAFSLLMVFGALLTALAETGFTASEESKASQTSINVGGPATSTPIILPTDATDVPTNASTEPPQATDTPRESASPTEISAGTSTQTGTAVAASATNSVTCTIPEGWTTYKIRSGDTLFSIAKLFQTSVSELQTDDECPAR